MKILKSIAAAFSMFSAIPVPYGNAVNSGNDERYFLCAFPLVGILTGLASGAAAYLCAMWELPSVLRGALLTVIPVLITGGIHLDGYADTCDALACFGSTEKKHEILKDPHIGTFAVIRLCVYFIAVFSIWCVLPEYPYINIILLYTQSRVLSGLSVVSFHMYKDTGLAYMFSEAADKKVVRLTLIISDLILLVLFAIQGYAGLVMTVTAHIVFALFHHMCRVKFEGLSGDLCGWFLCKCELWMLIALEVYLLCI